MVEGVKKGEGPAIALAAAVGALVSPLIVSAISGIFTAFSQIPFGIGIPLAITAVAGMMSLISKNKKQKVQDGVATSKNGPFEITDSYGRTAITATGDNLAVSPNLSMGGSTPSMDTRALEAKLDKLIAAVTAGGNVYLDGNKVGSAQVLGTYKSS